MIPIRDIDQHFTFFLPWAGMEKTQYVAEAHADVRAAGRMGKDGADRIVQGSEDRHRGSVLRPKWRDAVRRRGRRDSRDDRRLQAREKQRLRVIFENGTVSSMYRQSLSIRLFEQDRQAIVPTGLSDDEEILDGDTASGNIYVLRSLSTDPQITELRNLHKIGFTRGRSRRGSRTPKSPRAT